MPALQSGRPPLARRLWGARGQITSNHGATHKVYGGNKFTHVLGLVPSLPCTALPCLPPSSCTPDVQPCRTTTVQNISACVQRSFPQKTLTFRYVCVRVRVRACVCVLGAASRQSPAPRHVRVHPGPWGRERREPGSLGAEANYDQGLLPRSLGP